ncbi:MAG: 4Fe-4S dicluster domain-containing protein, partial [Synergistaceae bacterium]|nr:4Fe-4S dicluster domain-containing protein [Synergistaceae bacterium]
IIKAGKFLTDTPALSAFSQKVNASGSYPQIPAGAMSWARLLDKCIGCHACIKRCPSKALKPAGIKFGVNGALKPALDFSDGFCQYDCVACGHACPFGAIMPIDVGEKHKIQTGVASYARELCVITTKSEHCGACAEHCPTGALEMIPEGENKNPIPTINPKLCVGCGACEHICPVIPQKAITITPLPVHQAAEVLKAQDYNVLEDENDDFAF